MFPCFVLGNGPTLPENLDDLNPFFTIGVNRILERYDPTVLLWLDMDVGTLIAPYRDTMLAMPFTVDDMTWRGEHGIVPLGSLQHFDPIVLTRKDSYWSCGNSGVSAAFWAIALGCNPVYLLGMSAGYGKSGSNFYGNRQQHNNRTMKRMGRALKRLLQQPGVIVVADQRELDKAIMASGQFCKDRQWYSEQVCRLIT